MRLIALLALLLALSHVPVRLDAAKPAAPPPPPPSHGEFPWQL